MRDSLQELPRSAQLIIRAFKLDPIRWWRPAELQDAIVAHSADWSGRHISAANAKKLVQLRLRWLVALGLVVRRRLKGRLHAYHLELDPRKVGRLEFMLAVLLIKEFETRHMRGLLNLEVQDGGRFVVSLYRSESHPQRPSKRPPPLPRHVRLMLRKLLAGRPEAAVPLLAAVYREIGLRQGNRPIEATFTYAKADLASIRKYARFRTRATAYGNGALRNGARRGLGEE